MEVDGWGEPLLCVSQWHMEPICLLAEDYHPMKHHLIPLLSVVAWLVGPLGFAAAPIGNDKCLECHDDKDLTKDLAGGKTLSMYVGI